MSGAHTPGPWALSGMADRGLYGNNGELAIVSDETRIASVDCQSKFKRGEGYLAKCAERDANARLIAAAPDLLEELKRASRMLRRAANTAKTVGLGRDLDRQADELDAAIARAQPLGEG